MDYSSYIVFGVLAVVLVVMMIFSNKQKKKQAQEEQKKKDSLCKGTKVTTIGGIVGEVVSVTEDFFILKTASSEIKFDKRAIYQMELPNTKAVEETKTAEVKEEAKEVKEVETEDDAFAQVEKEAKEKKAKSTKKSK